MKVMKFGGGCLKDAADLERAAALVKESPAVVVVSAMGGVTDSLVLILERAATRKRFPASLYGDLVSRHHACARALLSTGAPPATIRAVDDLMAELKKLLRGIVCIGEVPPSIQARILGFGEQLASVLFSAALESRGLPAAACNAHRCGILADRPGTDARIDLARTRPRLRRNLRPLISTGKIPVITGFFGRAPDGTTATFGRNASDYSAAAIACALDARKLVIWKGVDGIMTMDPRYGTDARPVERLTWEEVGELTHFGAHILHPMTLEPLENSHTRVRIRNFRHPELPGTEIMAKESGSGERICGITCHPSATMLQLGIHPGTLNRALARLEEILRVPAARITSLVSARDRITLVMPSADARTARRALAAAIDPPIRLVHARDNRALVAVVGKALCQPRGLARLMDALATAGITIDGISPGGAALSLCLVIPDHQAGRCLQAIHNRFFPPTAPRPSEITTGDQP